MQNIYISNSLTRKKEKFVTLGKDFVGIYTCGPTVYSYPTIGNYRTYTTADLFIRVLKYNGYDVRYVMNITDVGHLTGDNLGDADMGEDRLEKASEKEGKTAWDIAKYYTEIFEKEIKELNFVAPDYLPKATDHIQEQIDLINKIEGKGFTYRIRDGVYFDTKTYEKVTKKKYGMLSTLDKIKAGARVKENREKKNARDFALWKFSGKGQKRQMEWDSPWGVGFPGWHLECSAMSMKYLGESFDIHIGGEDLRSTHHPNEIAQSESVTDKEFVKYWIHVAFLKVDGKRMSKSAGNSHTVGDIKQKGFDPLALRYLYLGAHYKDTLNFTWESLDAAQRSLMNLRNQVVALRAQTQRTVLSEEKRKKVDEYSKRFSESISDDVNTPKALAVLWEALKSNIPSEDKYDLAISFDEVLGLRLSKVFQVQVKIPPAVNKLADMREELRKNKKFEEADEVRDEIRKMGYDVSDSPNGVEIRKI